MPQTPLFCCVTMEHPPQLMCQGLGIIFGHAGSSSRRGLARKSRVLGHNFEGCIFFWVLSSLCCFLSSLGGQPCPLQIFMMFCLTRAQRWHHHPTTDWHFQTVSPDKSFLIFPPQILSHSNKKSSFHISWYLFTSENTLCMWIFLVHDSLFNRCFVSGEGRPW